MKNTTLRFIALSLIPVFFVGCASERTLRKEHADAAAVRFEARCKTAGEFIHRTVGNVEGVYLLKVRPDKINRSEQYTYDDPYGRDHGGEYYIRSFLHGAYTTEVTLPKVLPPDFPPHIAYGFVDVLDASDGKRYRYTGRVEEPALTKKGFLPGHKIFVHSKSLANGPAPRFGVTYDDISTKEDRDYWIAGSSLKVIDLEKNEIIAERIGYFYDSAQGDTSGGRSPWLRATSNACPSFGSTPAFGRQPDQAAVFVEKVLRPKS
ncbi:hypothetical protein F2P44_31665 [Massilia sp. CCM 8695]|uniref:Lipoprotein n=1 Tax=Massilia frigida TaxID=2609281 RepID=A0ABX0NEA1_9BURK|nr:hypothetical protein [Massilia frigida]NHZ83792.1 hypothetical protein [Massilia frigida]